MKYTSVIMGPNSGLLFRAVCPTGVTILSLASSSDSNLSFECCMELVDW
jgi:hypothetical protein